MSNTTPTYSSPALNFLKADLGYFDSALPGAIESNLIDLLSVAEQRLKEDCGITLMESDISDAQLQSMYAAWLYRSRATGTPKHQMLKDAIRNKQVNGSTVTENAYDL